jgi:hypothetical protein
MSDIGQCIIFIFYNIKPEGKQYHLIMLMGPKGGRKEAPCSAVAADVSAKVAEHSKETKARNSFKLSPQAVQSDRAAV